MSGAAARVEGLVRRREVRRRAGWGAAAVPLVAALVVVLVIRVTGLEDIGWIQNAMLVFSGLLVEALPFVLLGAIVSAAIEVFVPSRTFNYLASVPRRYQVSAAAFGGFAFPVCECGSVPVARRLVVRGLDPRAAVTFMLAAPVVNPIVILSTIFAFQGRSILWLMVGGRVLLGLIVAVIGGLAAGPALAQPDSSQRTSVHAHQMEGGSRAADFVGHMGSDFAFMARFMMAGALVAALIQTAVPQNAIDQVSQTVVLAIVAMMVFAFVLSLCSESDAILISSFTQFSPASMLAFLVFGPMMDIKLVALYSGSFGARFVRVLLPVLAVAVLIGCLWIELFDRL